MMLLLETHRIDRYKKIGWWWNHSRNPAGLDFAPVRGGFTILWLSVIWNPAWVRAFIHKASIGIAERIRARGPIC